MARFLRDVRVELSKVTWPTRNELHAVDHRRHRRRGHRRHLHRGRSTGVFAHLMQLILPK